MVLAADDMGDGVVDIIDNRGHGIDDPSILAKQHRVGQAGHMIADIAANHVGPGHLAMLKQETPVRAASLGLQRSFLSIGQLQRRTVIDWWTPGGQL